jgi:hypothetical protein
MTFGRNQQLKSQNTSHTRTAFARMFPSQSEMHQKYVVQVPQLGLRHGDNRISVGPSQILG